MFWRPSSNDSAECVNINKHHFVFGRCKQLSITVRAMDNDIDSLLLRQFSSMATQDRDVLIAEFSRLLGVQNELSCSFYLEMNNWLDSLRTNRVEVVYTSVIILVWWHHSFKNDIEHVIWR